MLANACRSSTLRVGRGVFRVLIALVIEPLAESIRTNINICGLTVANNLHKITLYANNILVFMVNSENQTCSVFHIAYFI